MSNKVSIIIPVYDVEKYINRCIESVVNQTYTNLEIILVNDGSPDGCPQICDNWAEKDKRVVVIHKENGGLSDARNVGIDGATGVFISFIDSDDIIAPNMIEFLYYSLVNNDADIAITTMNPFCEKLPLFTKENDIICDFADKILYEIMCKSFHWEACGKLYKIALFDNGLRFIKGKLCEDLHFTLRVFAEAERAVYCDNAMYGYFQRNDSIMGKTKISISKDLIDVLQSNSDFIKDQYRDNIEFYRQLFATFILHPSTKLEDIESNKSYNNNHTFIKEYKKYIRRNWWQTKDNAYISKKYKFGLFVSMYSVIAYNKLFKIVRYLQKREVIQWKR